MKLRLVALLALGCGGLSACSEPEDTENPTSLAGGNAAVTAVEPEAIASNPFFAESPLYLNYPPFDRIDNAHYLPAFERGMAEEIAEIEAIASQPAAPSFENTLLALELSGQLLNRVSRVFFSLAGAHTNDDIRALEQRLAPELAAHTDNILLHRTLFGRVKSLYDRRDSLALDAESARLLEQYYIDFVRAGDAL